MTPNPEIPPTLGTAVPPADNPQGGKAGSPVIRRLDVLSEDSRERLLRRVAPAWAISGIIHVILVMIALVIFGGKKAAANVEDKVVSTSIEDSKDKEDNLVNDDVGFDADLQAATDAAREADKNVEAPVVENQPVDAMKNDSDAPIVGMAQGFGDPSKDSGVTGDLVANSNSKLGEGGGFNAMATRGLSQRASGASKDILIGKYGGNAESEAAVGRGLIWLAKQQKEDGSWRYDGGDKTNEVAAATGMALLPFLAAGETHKYGKHYQQNVSRGLSYLQNLVGSNGKVNQATSMYGHAIATIALCEAVGMTRDRSQLREKAQLAVNYIVKAQATDGSWGYTPGASGDTSIVGWQVQALKSAILAELKVDKAVLEKAVGFLDRVSTDSGSRYGYRDNENTTNLLSSVGLLCRQYISGWGPGTPGLIKGVDEFLKSGMPTRANFDIYFHYYATQVVHFFEGPAWHQKWNPAMRDLLISLQRKNSDDKNRGSWDADGFSIGTHCSRLGTTCLSLLTLEVYYRHLPLNKRDNAGLAELNR